MTDQAALVARGRKNSLFAGARALLRLMPKETQRSVIWSMLWALLLAGLEFASFFLLYPVFAFLAQGGTDTASLPIVGWTIDRTSARYLAFLALGLMILRSLSTLAYRRWWLGVTARAELELSTSLLRSYAYAPYVFHLMTKSSDLMARAVANVNVACQSGLVGIVGIASSALLITGLAGALVAVDPDVGLILVVYVGFLALSYALMTKRFVRRLAQELELRVGLVYGIVSTFLRGIREITVFGLREQYLTEVRARREKMVRVWARVSLLQDLPKAFLEVALYASVLIALSALLSMQDPDEVLPLIALYVVAGMRITPTLSSLLGNVTLVRTGAQIANTLATEMRNIEELKPIYPVEVKVEAQKASLVISGVEFHYIADGPKVLQGIDLTIPFGTFLGLIGESGSGKTTLLSVLLGLLEPSGGTIKYGDQVVKSNDSDWFDKVAILPQDVFITDESLLDNVLAGKAMDRELLEDVIGMAELDPMVSELPQGLHTPLAEGGSRLSAGQRQRVGLARALYRQPEILFLDEPTSALDNETEAHILGAIESLKGRMTIVAVAHRLHTLGAADQVIRIQGGRIVAAGKLTDLLVVDEL